jgi:hypothetical protein
MLLNDLGYELTSLKRFIFLNHDRASGLDLNVKTCNNGCSGIRFRIPKGHAVPYCECEKAGFLGSVVLIRQVLSIPGLFAETLCPFCSGILR